MIQKIVQVVIQEKLVITYHTLAFGERWLDWGTQAITGDFNNSGSCGGNGTVDVNGDLCGTGSNVNGNPVNVDPIPGRNHGLVDCGSGADCTYPQKMYQILINFGLH